MAFGAFAVTAYGLSGRLLPGLADLARSNSADGRLEQPLTYWNAMGGLGAIGLVSSLRLAADYGARGRCVPRRRLPPRRWAWAPTSASRAGRCSRW